ncbi:TlpA family protein disulfide reductase [Sulfidibacter corallicola]|uniref:TlpA family protein disulfide reductase n=1 Tax=Sulfidibacter corallicola TaxID=2818388 RepID=A0A8A4TPI3_SULCO|nr:TlpA disulfide reductase family protein [Sulfidibacter corallicola]QTD51879.1 TlpA family protein disulfide reductase [Sulfidibacter corallicola]
MTLFLTVLIAVGHLAGPHSDPPGSDAKTHIRRCIETMMAVSTLTYDYRYYGTGVMAQQVPPQEGVVLIRPTKKGQPGQYTTAWLKSGDRELMVKDQRVFRYDHAAKVVFHNPLHRVGMPNDDRRKFLAYEGLAYLASSPSPRIVTADNPGDTTIEIELANGALARATVNDRGFLRKLAMTFPDWGGWSKASMVLEINNIRIDEHCAREGRPFPVDFEVKPYSGNFPQVGKPAPTWDLAAPNGDRVSLEDLRGHWVVMDFWAEWCPPCLKGIPAIEKLHQRYRKKGVKFFGVTWKEQGNAAAILRKRGGTYPILVGDPIAEAYRLEESGLPVIYLISPEGQLVDFIRDPRGAEDILPDLLSELLEKDR